ncbi:hypothetical protein [Lentzea flava]|uniref:Uncharacterized protein n=1 Tax=Lentzea flava TaxID=103732 RepID=A0ABQ2VGP6_9PSEU|nr:hypothetical protein [Lentzea flava]GGU84558.1 hypothetical protein GCM10010178_88560 [Lentzea flava]
MSISADGPVVSAHPPPGNDNACRALYARALDPEGLFTLHRVGDKIRAELRRLSEPDTERQNLDELRQGVAAWAEEESDRSSPS